jgi:hypothetical protein
MAAWWCGGGGGAAEVYAAGVHSAWLVGVKQEGWRMKRQGEEDFEGGDPGWMGWDEVFGWMAEGGWRTRGLRVVAGRGGDRSDLREVVVVLRTAFCVLLLLRHRSRESGHLSRKRASIDGQREKLAANQRIRIWHYSPRPGPGSSSRGKFERRIEFCGGVDDGGWGLVVKCGTE